MLKYFNEEIKQVSFIHIIRLKFAHLYGHIDKSASKLADVKTNFAVNFKSANYNQFKKEKKVTIQ